MGKVIAISGPSSTGKTSLIEALSMYKELSGVVFSPDLYNHVWGGLVEQKLFNSYDEIVRDSEYICIYLIRLIDYYEKSLNLYKESDKLIILDCCWIDLLVYAVINMWNARPIKSLQEEILGKIHNLSKTVDRIYFTRFDQNKQEKRPYKSDIKIYTIKSNRSLELTYYNTYSDFKCVEKLPSSDIDECALFILDDLKKLGYL